MARFAVSNENIESVPVVVREIVRALYSVRLESHVTHPRFRRDGFILAFPATHAHAMRSHPPSR